MTDWKLKSIADVAPTLKDLKSLSVHTQSLLLLRRLATQFPSSDMSFAKINFGIPAYASMLNQGYAGHEASQVKDLLLGAPWKDLEAQGFIRDNGQGHFVVTAEGFEAARNSESTTVNREVLAAIQLLHPDFKSYGHYFQDNRLKEAVAAAFECYENRLNTIRDQSRKSAVKSSAGPDLVYKLFNAKILKLPYRKLGGPTRRAAYEKGLCGILSGGVSWIRNSYTHEKHHLPDLQPQEALELLFVASYLLRMVEYSLSDTK